MKSCKEVCSMAQDYVDGELPFLSRMAIRLHVLMCRDCTSFIAQTRAVRAALGRIAPDGHAATGDRPSPILTEAVRSRRARLRGLEPARSGTEGDKT